jgi:hypothetical protein
MSRFPNRIPDVQLAMQVKGPRERSRSRSTSGCAAEASPRLSLADTGSLYVLMKQDQIELGALGPAAGERRADDAW